jgi:hypothetical protein
MLFPLEAFASNWAGTAGPKVAAWVEMVHARYGCLRLRPLAEVLNSPETDRPTSGRWRRVALTSSRSPACVVCVVQN